MLRRSAPNHTVDRFCCPPRGRPCETVVKEVMKAAEAGREDKQEGKSNEGWWKEMG
jgi:hypothetical protein